MPPATADWSESPPPPSGPPRKLRWIILRAALVLFAPVIAFFSWEMVETFRLSREIGRMTAAGQGRPADRLSVEPETSDHRRAARHYAEAIKQAAGAEGKPFEEIGRTIEALSALAPRDVRADPRLAALQQIEERYAEALAQLDQATPLDAVGLERADQIHTFGARYVQNVNVVRIARLAFRGEGDRAVSALFASLRLRRIYRPIFGASGVVPTLHGLELILNFSEPSASALDRLQREYTDIAAAQSVESRLAHAREQFIDGMMSRNFEARNPMQALTRRLARPLMMHRLVPELQKYEEAIAAASQPWPQKLEAVDALARKYNYPRRGERSTPRGFWERTLGPARYDAAILDAMNATPTIAQALARANVSIAAIAAVRYRRGTDNWPETLAALSPQYMTNTDDPYSGKALRYRLEGQALKVYSVGANRKDDGGTWERRSELHRFERRWAGDIGLTLLPIAR